MSITFNQFEVRDDILNFRAYVDVATTNLIDLIFVDEISPCPPIIDGVILKDGNRILIKDCHNYNGVYEFYNQCIQKVYCDQPEGSLCLILKGKTNIHKSFVNAGNHNWKRFDALDILDINRGGTGKSKFDDGILYSKNDIISTKKVNNKIIINLSSSELVIDNTDELEIAHFGWHTSLSKYKKIRICVSGIGVSVISIYCDSNREEFDTSESMHLLNMPISDTANRLTLKVRKRSSDSVIPRIYSLWLSLN
jgi:hypothetical protein